MSNKADVYISPTAIVEEGAKLGKGVYVGPYSIVGANVVLGDGVKLQSHVIIDGHTIIGKNNVFYPFSAIGTHPQDLKYKGENTQLIIGDNNVFRENVTVNIGTVGGGGITKIGDNNLFMAYTHIAHDCIIGNNVILANNVQLAGHVYIEDWVVIGGSSAVVQFVRVGKHAYVGGFSGIQKDFPPFFTGYGVYDLVVSGVNIVGLKRRGFSKDTINSLRKAYRYLYQSDILLVDAVSKIEKELNTNDAIKYLLDFLKNSKKGVH